MIKYYRPPHSTTSGERETGYVYEQAPICAQADEVDIRPARCLPNPIAHASRLAHESGDMLATYGVHQGQLFSVSTGHDIHDPREQTRIRKVPPTRQMVSRGSAYCVDVDDNNIDGCTPGLVAGYTIGDQMDETTNRIRMRPVHPGRVSPVFGSPACRPNVRSRLDHVNHCSSNSRSLITNPSSNGTRITLDDVLDFRGSYSARVPPVIPVKHPSDQGAESPAPSLLCSSNPTTNTNATSELCESLCASLSRFRLPPSPLLDETSPAAREPPPFRSGRDLDSGDLYPESNLPSPPSQSFLNSLHKLPQSSQPDRFVAAQSRWDPVTSRKDWSIGLSDLSNSRCSRVRRLPLTPPERYPTLINPDSSSVINNHTKDESGFPKDCVTSTHSPRDNMNTSVYTRKTVSPSMSAYDVHLIDRSDSVISGDRI
ncbi:hypothetical protein D915_000311 [Fasciola hepatica]|uniref:Uncharacterized protein n=1 Tax=Fasciola hepatica TaxID=6192 RepID=A0A4E0RIT7_FASHE|nr:hypothetical protein D915_000311 [Fasciola hepatica]